MRRWVRSISLQSADDSRLIEGAHQIQTEPSNQLVCYRPKRRASKLAAESRGFVFFFEHSIIHRRGEISFRMVKKPVSVLFIIRMGVGSPRICERSIEYKNARLWPTAHQTWTDRQRTKRNTTRAWCRRIKTQRSWSWFWLLFANKTSYLFLLLVFLRKKMPALILIYITLLLITGLDNLHEYLKFSYPRLKPPSFICENETKQGLTLHYRSKRRGFVYYTMGQIREVSCGHLPHIRRPQ